MSHRFTTKTLSLLASALALAVFGANGAVGAESPVNVDARDAKMSAAAAAAKERAKKATGSELRKLYDEIKERREEMIADFDAVAKQMKDASEEKKKELREKLEAQKKNFEEVTNALMKRIRDEQQKQRASAIPGKR